MACNAVNHPMLLVFCVPLALPVLSVKWQRHGQSPWHTIRRVNGVGWHAQVVSRSPDRDTETIGRDVETCSRNGGPVVRPVHNRVVTRSTRRWQRKRMRMMTQFSRAAVRSRVSRSNRRGVRHNRRGGRSAECPVHDHRRSAGRYDPRTRQSRDSDAESRPPGEFGSRLQQRVLHG